MMTTQIRDTQFGHVVRFLSRRRLFRYNDEIDASLYKGPRGQDINVPIGCCDRQNMERTSDRKEQGGQHLHSNDINTYRIGEMEQDVLLVDWYGPNDPEVCIVTTASKNDTHMQSESTKLVSQLEAFGHISNLCPQLRRLFCEFHICCRRAELDERIWGRRGSRHTRPLTFHCVRLILVNISPLYCSIVWLSSG